MDKPDLLRLFSLRVDVTQEEITNTSCQVHKKELKIIGIYTYSNQHIKASEGSFSVGLQGK